MCWLEKLLFGKVKFGKDREDGVDKLSDDQIIKIRMNLSSFSAKLLDIPYEYGAEWLDYSKMPESLDCSELVQGVYGHFKMKMPDGSYNQFTYTQPVQDPLDADLAFFGRGGKTNKIYHVGLVYGEFILEARGYQSSSSFKTGCVILRPKTAWVHYKNFVGFRRHPKLA